MFNRVLTRSNNLLTQTSSRTIPMRSAPNQRIPPFQPTRVSIERSPRSFYPYRLASSATPSTPARSAASTATLSAEDRYKYTQEELDAKESLAKGNTAEAYGLSPEAGAIGDSGVLQKYGAWTVGSLFLASAISKEWIMLGAETPLVLTFSGVVFTLYVSMREGVLDYVKTTRQEQLQFYEEIVDNQISKCTSLRERLVQLNSAPQELSERWNNFFDLTKRYQQAKNRAEQNHLNHTYESKLEALTKIEQRQKDRQNTDIQASAGRYIRENFRSKDQKYRDSFVTAALSNLLLSNASQFARQGGDVKSVISSSAFQEAAGSVGLKSASSEDVVAKGKEVDSLQGAHDDRPEHPAVQSLYKDFLAEWNKKSGQAVVRNLTDAEYQQALNDADKALKAELAAFDKRVAESRKEFAENVKPPMISQEKLSELVAQREESFRKKRESIVAGARKPARQVTEFRPFYNN